MPLKKQKGRPQPSFCSCHCRLLWTLAAATKKPRPGKDGEVMEISKAITVMQDEETLKTKERSRREMDRGLAASSPLRRLSFKHSIVLAPAKTTVLRTMAAPRPLPRPYLVRHLSTQLCWTGSYRQGPKPHRHVGPLTPLGRVRIRKALLLSCHGGRGEGRKNRCIQLNLVADGRADEIQHKLPMITDAVNVSRWEATSSTPAQ